VLFYTPIFLFLFLPLSLLTVFALRGTWRDAMLLAWSGLFYFWGEPWFVFVAVLSACMDHWIAEQVFRWHGTPTARSYMVVGVLLNLAVLALFKYLDFFVGSANAALASLGIPALPLLRLALPIGVSFVVFEKITYVVDVYRGRGEPARSLGSYLLYVLLFPKLLAGPIVKYHDIAAQLTNHGQTIRGFLEGFERFLLGLAKKVLLADTLGEMADAVFSLPPDRLGFGSSWLGVICFALQIYFDFSAYSDMAIGLARMFGFRLLENFNLPYIATSFTDFWRRWHISLSTWIKEYLYFSLGGNRGGRARTYFNLWVCFLLSGLWHGASWTFVLWGAYNGLFLVVDKLFWVSLSQRLPRVANIGITLFFVLIGWVLFRATSLAQIGGFLGAMASPGRHGASLYVTSNVWVAVCIGVGVCLIPAFGRFEVTLGVWRALPPARAIEAWLLGGLSLLAIAKAVTVTFNPFLYFRF
jgi:alginate O-acetyltransferase complex protein AlgI